MRFTTRSWRPSSASWAVDKKPASVMVRAVVTTSGKKSPLVAVGPGVKVNTAKDLQTLEEKGLAWRGHLGAANPLVQDEECHSDLVSTTLT